MIIRVIEKEKWTNKTRPCQKKHGRYTLEVRKIGQFYGSYYFSEKSNL